MRSARAIAAWGVAGVFVANSILFLHAGFEKLLGLGQFRGLIERHDLLPGHLVGAASVGVVAVELGAGAGSLVLLLGARRAPWAGAIGALPWLVFAAYSLALVADPPPKPVPCGCTLGSAQPANWAGLAARDAAFGAALVMIGAAGRRLARAGPALTPPGRAPR